MLIFSFYGLPKKLNAGTHKAICSFYTDYHPCRVTISDTHIEANLPTDYLYVDETNFLDLKVYEDLGKSSNLIVMGDFNVSPEDIDIGIGEENAKRWLRDGKTSFQPQEREMWNSIKDLGFIDSWRELFPNESSIYSWFDYRSRMFDQNPKRGLRIDHILLSDNLKKSINNVGIDYDARSMEKPSDHCPVWLELNE